MNVYFLQVSTEPRYWEDTIVNGEVDNDGSRIPFRNGDLWEPKIRLWDGVIMGWPKGMTAEIHYKVCDQGDYYLSGEIGNRIAKYASYYVPDEFLCHGDRGYGDYIIMRVDGNGQILHYQRPKIDVDKWDACDPRVKPSLTIAEATAQ